MPITTVCLNPCIDRTVWVDSFVRGGTNRVRREECVPGGKGVNTARALAAQRVPVRLATLMGREDVAKMQAYLHPLGCEMRAVLVDGAVRVNVKVFDSSRNEVTEINAPGSPVAEETLAEMTELILRCAKESRWLVLSGSMPPGFTTAYYAQLIRRVRACAKGCQVALDAEGESFRLGVMEGPDFVKPNQHELSLFLGREVKSRDEIMEGARALRGAGAKAVVVSMGAEGAVLCADGHCVFAPALSVPVKTTVGSGDALLSGYLAARYAGQDNLEAFRRGVAAATAHVSGEIGNMDAYLPLVSLFDERRNGTM